MGDKKGRKNIFGSSYIPERKTAKTGRCLRAGRKTGAILKKIQALDPDKRETRAVVLPGVSSFLAPAESGENKEGLAIKRGYVDLLYSWIGGGKGTGQRSRHGRKDSQNDRMTNRN